MAEITPIENKAENRRLRHAFVPTPLEIIMLLSGSFLFLLVANSLPTIRSLDNTSYSMVTTYLKDIAEKLLAPTNNQQGSTILTGVFWLFVGIFTYMIVWAVASIISAYRSDVMATKGMVLPQGYSTKRVFHETLVRMAIRVLSTIMFLYWLYLFFASILPYASFTFLDALSSLSFASLGWIALSTLITAGSVFVALVFLRCIFLRERIFMHEV